MGTSARPTPDDRTAGPSRRNLLGRERERAALDELVSGLWAGRSTVLSLRGEVGVGKTALLHYVGEHAVGCTVVRVAGVESELEFAYAGLHQICLPLMGGLESLPRPQREALTAAFGLTSSAAPDRFLVGLAVLGLLSEAARLRPVLCLLDDAHWLDDLSLETLAFAARRLGSTPVAVVSTRRVPAPTKVPELVVRGLREHDAAVLLRSVVPGPLDEGVRRRLLTEADGNPLALLELPRDLTPEQLAGGYGMPDTGTLPSRIERSYARRLDALPAATRQLLLIVAAEPGQDPVLIWRAARLLHIDVSAAAPALTSELVDFGGEVRFHHPLLRSAVYRSASAENLRAVHRALAEATSPELDPDRRAWHLAHATAGLDEDVAAELDRSAGRAQARGGFAAAAAFRERASALTPDPARRAERALLAAACKFQAGAHERAVQLLTVADTEAADALTRARAILLRAQIASATGHGADAPLLAAAQLLEARHPELALESYRDALYATLITGRAAAVDGTGIRGTARVALSLRVSPLLSGSDVDRPPATILAEGAAALVLDGYVTGAPRLRAALTSFRAVDTSTGPGMRALPLATRMAHDLWDEHLWDDMSTRMASAARAHGHLRMLPVALLSQLALRLMCGDGALARALVDEISAVTTVTNRPSPPYADLVSAAWQGDEQRLGAVIDAVRPDTVEQEGQWVTARGWAESMLANALGRYDEALVAAERGSSHPEELGLANWAMVELVEAAARAGTPTRAAGTMRRIAAIAEGCDTDWARGTAARCRALLAKGPEAEQLYRESLEVLGRSKVRWLEARTHLVYGEWLRREGRRVDARVELGAALEMLTEMGSDAFAERARRELAATGASARRRSAGSSWELTEQESQIARLATDGRTNPQIAGELFLSARTVEWHLRKVYLKLGITSRKELTRPLVEAGRPRAASQQRSGDVPTAGPVTSGRVSRP